MGLVVREAQRSDTEQLLGEISHGIYHGIDYFPGWLPHMWTEPGREMWVCTDTDADEKIVGLETLKSVDDGLTAVPQSLRVLPSYRGKGVSKLLGDRFTTCATEKGFKRMRSSTRQDNVASISIFKKGGFEEVFRQGTFIIHPVLGGGAVDAPDLDELLVTDPVVVAEAVMPYVGDMLIAEWTPYSTETLEATVTSVRKIQELGFSFIVDKTRGAMSYFKLCDYPRGKSLLAAVLTNGQAEPLVAHNLHYYNKSVAAQCHSFICFYDMDLFSTPDLPPHLKQLQAVTKAPYDTDNFNLTGAGMTVLEKSI